MRHHRFAAMILGTMGMLVLTGVGASMAHAAGIDGIGTVAKINPLPPPRDQPGFEYLITLFLEPGRTISPDNRIQVNDFAGVDLATVMNVSDSPFSFSTSELGPLFDFSPAAVP